MGKNEESNTTLKRSWFQELKGEFNKITWPSKQSLIKQTTVVIIISVLLGCLIAFLDWAIKIGLNYIVA